MRATPKSAPRFVNPTLIGLASALALIVAAPAGAGKRNSAPIDYRTHSQTGQSTQAPQQRRAQAQQRSSSRYASQPSYSPQPRRYNAAPVRQARGSVTRANARIEFRYPDQPEVVYAQNGARTVTTPAPIAFSSADAAISEQSARQYANLQAPANSVERQVMDPAISYGGFDARASAERIAAAKRPVQIEEVDLAPLTSAMPQGVAFTPLANPGFDQTGVASWYGDDFHGQQTANGEIFDMDGLTAAHPTLPLPSLVQVINPANGREVVLRVNDRGPFEPGRMIDVSRRAAMELGFVDQLEANVRVRYLGPAPVAGQGSAMQPQTVSAPVAPAPVYTQAERAIAGEAPTMQPIPNPVGNYFVQVGSFSEIANAEALYAALGSGMPVEIVPARVNGADYFRVMVGPLETHQTATALREHLYEQGIADGRIIEK